MSLEIPPVILLIVGISLLCIGLGIDSKDADRWMKWVFEPVGIALIVIWTHVVGVA